MDLNAGPGALPLSICTAPRVPMRSEDGGNQGLVVLIGSKFGWNRGRAPSVGFGFRAQLKPCHVVVPVHLEIQNRRGIKWGLQGGSIVFWPERAFCKTDHGCCKTAARWGGLQRLPIGTSSIFHSATLPSPCPLHHHITPPRRVAIWMEGRAYPLIG